MYKYGYMGQKRASKLKKSLFDTSVSQAEVIDLLNIYKDYSHFFFGPSINWRFQGPQELARIFSYISAEGLIVRMTLYSITAQRCFLLFLQQKNIYTMHSLLVCTG
jgi:hypothetical protein